MKKKLLLVLCILVYSTLQTIAQQSFITDFGKQGMNQIAYSSTQDTNGNYFSVGYSSDLQFTQVNAMLVKTNSAGVVVAIKYETKQDTMFFHQDITILPTGNLLVLSLTDNDFSNPDNITGTFVVSQYSPNLELLNRFSLPIPGNADVYKAQMRFQNNYIYCKGSKYANETEFPGSFIYKMNLQGDSIIFKNWEAQINDYFVSSNNDLFLVGDGFIPGANYSTNKFNSQTLAQENIFDFFNSSGFPMFVGVGFMEIEPNTDSTFLFLREISTSPYKIGLGVMDTSFNILNYTESMNDGPEFSGYINGLVHTQNNFTYTVTGYYLLGFIHIRKFNANLTLVWDKFISPQNAWIYSATTATLDNGCMITASYTKPDEMGIRLIKIAPDGTITSTNDLPNLKVSELLLYPNPGKEELHLKTAFQKLGGTFVLTDVSGKKVLEKNISQNETILSTQNLKQGIYFYTYFYKNKPLETGKWVKQ